MNAILSIKNIDESLHQPGYWTQKRLLILIAIQSAVGSKKEISVESHKTIYMSVQKSYTIIGRPKGNLSVAEIAEINEVLCFLQEREWNCKFLTIPQKRERVSILPKNENELAAYQAFKVLSEHFWTDTVVKKDKISPAAWNRGLVFAATLEIAASSGLSVQHLYDVYAQLNTVDTLPSTLNVRVHSKAPEEATIQFPLSPKAVILINAILHQRGLKALSDKKQINSLRFPVKQTDINSLISRRINELPETKATSLTLDSVKPFDILSAAKYETVVNGLEPIIQSRLSSDLLPLSPPKNHDSFKFIEKHNQGSWPRIINRPEHIRSSKSPKQTDFIRTLRSQLADSEDIERYCWLDICRIEIRRAIQKLRRSLTDDSGKYHNSTVNPEQCAVVLKAIKPKCIEHFLGFSNSKNDVDKVQKLSEVLRNEALSSLDLAIAWMEFRLITEPVTLDTVRKDISQLFNQALFQYEASYDLTVWDEEDAEILVSEFLLDRDLSDSTTNQIIGLMRQLCRFARSHLELFRDIEFPLEYEGNGLTITRRNNILGLQELDLVTTKIMESQDPHAEQQACILDLAGYGGLRSGEIANLTLNSIVVNRNEIVIYLPRFKTPSAYRSIPLHRIAPPEVCRRVQSVVEYRQIHLRKYNNKAKKKLSMEDVYLFSTDENIDHCSSPEMVFQARETLKSFCGEGADLHLLRHGFATHLFLRWYCSRYEELLDELVERSHWCYSSEGIASLRLFLGESPYESLPATNVTSVVHLLKLMGHKTVTTFFRVYVHSFEVVAHHALQRYSAIEGQEIVQGKVIAALVPNCKSRTNQAKINDKSFAGLAKWILNQRYHHPQDAPQTGRVD